CLQYNTSPYMYSF
nr:immunoglobulin light chain junction region [Macaca mulatta]MOX27032.1 immunoglobulin light chain junction region [Macaca mulatta]